MKDLSINIKPKFDHRYHCVKKCDWIIHTDHIKLFTLQKAFNLILFV